MSCCWKRDRARLLPRIAPAFCGTGGHDETLSVELIEAMETPQCLTDVIDCDPETAACRALAQYLAMCEGEHAGRVTEFQTIVHSWPDMEDLELGLPALAIHRGTAVGQYDRNLSPSITQLAPGSPYALLTATDWICTLQVEVMATSKEERVGLRMLLEEALYPVDWLAGARVRVPWYGGTHLEFALETGGHVDNAEAIAQKIRGMTFGVRVVVPVIRLIKRPVAKVVARGEVLANSADRRAGRSVSIR